MKRTRKVWVKSETRDGASNRKKAEVEFRRAYKVISFFIMMQDVFK